MEKEKKVIGIVDNLNNERVATNYEKDKSLSEKGIYELDGELKLFTESSLKHHIQRAERELRRCLCLRDSTGLECACPMCNTIKETFKEEFGKLREKEEWV